MADNSMLLIAVAAGAAYLWWQNQQKTASLATSSTGGASPAPPVSTTMIPSSTYTAATNPISPSTPLPSNPIVPTQSTINNPASPFEGTPLPPSSAPVVTGQYSGSPSGIVYNPLPVTGSNYIDSSTGLPFGFAYDPYATPGSQPVATGGNLTLFANPSQPAPSAGCPGGNCATEGYIVETPAAVTIPVYNTFTNLQQYIPNYSGPSMQDLHDQLNAWYVRLGYALTYGMKNGVAVAPVNIWIRELNTLGNFIFPESDTTNTTVDFNTAWNSYLKPLLTSIGVSGLNGLRGLSGGMAVRGGVV